MLRRKKGKPEKEVSEEKEPVSSEEIKPSEPAPTPPPPTVEKPQSAPQPEAKKKEFPAASEATVAPVGGVNSAMEEFQAIQQMMGPEDDGMLAVPVKAVMNGLSEEMRGPSWSVDNVPDQTVNLDKDELLGQLKTGRVQFAVSAFSSQLPDGWLASSVAPDAMVELSLSDLVAAIPPNMLQAATQPSAAAEAVKGMKEFFAPTRPAKAAPEAQPVEEKPAAPEKPAAIPISQAAPKAQEEKKSAPVQPAAAAPKIEKKPEPQPAKPPVETKPEPAPAPPASEKRPEPAPAAQKAPAPAAPPVQERPKPAAHAHAAAASQLPKQRVALKRRSRPAVKKPVVSEQWDGVERSFDSAPQGVDVNSSNSKELEKVFAVGPMRAMLIEDYRKTHGRYKNVYELANVPGIGPSVFKKLTGLSVKSRTRRHDKLIKLLDFQKSRQPTIPEIASTVAEKLSATGTVFTNFEGMCLAKSGVDEATANQLAAHSAHLIQRTEKYFTRLAGNTSDCIVLPSSEPPLMLLYGENFVLVLTMKTTTISPKIIRKARLIAREIEWLMSRRAIVRFI